MPIVILGAAAITSYLIPLIITCVISGVTIVVTFVTTRFFYKKKHENDGELERLKKEQMERDHAVRDEVSKIARETGIDIQVLLNLSREQQLELKRNIQEFMKNIDESDNATKNLNCLANTIQEATINANLQSIDLNTELEKMKTELINVYSKLSNTEKILANKEAELNQTLEKINTFGDKILNSDILEQLNAMQNIQKEFNLIYPASFDEEINSLKSKNINLSNTINTLKKTINQLNTKLETYSENEKRQLTEIQKLINDNKLLTETIEALTNSIDSQNQKTKKPSINTSNNLRMFN